MESVPTARHIDLVRGDIVLEATDAIVNAANTSLLGGGGVDGAIHRAGGPDILSECRALPADERGRRCVTGQVRTTCGGNLPAKWVIHAVGPVYRRENVGRAERLLREVHRAALKAASDLGCRSVAFPAISTGAYGYPTEEAAPIAIEEARNYLAGNPGSLEWVRFVLFSRKDLELFEAALAAAG